MFYTIDGFEGSNIIFKLSNGQSLKINTLEYRDYCPPLKVPKNKSTHYTVIENNQPSDERGYKIGDVVTIGLTDAEKTATQMRLGFVFPKEDIIEDKYGHIMKYRIATQYDLDKFESIYHSTSDNAKVYNYIMFMIHE